MKRRLSSKTASNWKRSSSVSNKKSGSTINPWVSSRKPIRKPPKQK